ncbi:calponin homology domain-containing protein [Phascolomyces articulosus]|uniref:Calponin homology domain-containing protein n=1 Tax=Phascolomyces articulosus TaxID=60185 RepID=A0AAD5P8U0_9FUNG|nr:calponin homology domain-containing protein [Phascolomyces articulosus]
MKSCLSFDFLTPNVDQQHTARLWIQSVLQIQLPDSDNLYTSLRDGVFLCKLMNDLIPNSIPFIYYENNMDAWTKNIQQFLIASEQNGGLDTFQLFDINDLLYGHDMIAVSLIQSWDTIIKNIGV